MEYMPLFIIAIKTKPIVSIISFAAMFFILPILNILPVLNTINTSLTLWLVEILNKPFNSALYLIFSTLFSIYITLYIYTRNNPICCNIHEMKYARSGILGSILGFIVGICPSCFSFVAFLLPLSISITLSVYSTLFIGLAIALMVFSVYKLGGFKNIKELTTL